MAGRISVQIGLTGLFDLNIGIIVETSFDYY
jgi:hypothetical protein